MAEQMTLDQVRLKERQNSGTSITGHEEFDAKGYLIVKNLWDAEELLREVPAPNLRGQISYWSNSDEYDHSPLETQVEGSLAVYGHPQYRYIHSGIRLKLEKIIGKKLYNTYYYDRFYFVGQGLTVHSDRDACEISVSVHISTNLEERWPLWIKTPDIYDGSEISQLGENHGVCLKPGDGMIYKGCERPHWRDPLPSRNVGNYYTEEVDLLDDTFYHQVFFHYVLADGLRVQYANDMSKGDTLHM